MNWDNQPITKNEYYHMLTMLMVQNDVNTIFELLETLRQPVIMMTAMPYLSLFCCSFREYSEKCGTPFTIKNNSTISPDLSRLSLKQFDERYSKAINIISNVNHNQDKQYKSLIKFKLLRKFNLNYNIGIYFDNNGHVISNSQNIFQSFQDKRFNKSLDQNNLKEFGVALGTVLNSIKTGIDLTMPPISPLVTNCKFKINYCDKNSKHINSTFKKMNNGMEIYLWLLHILCNINFVRYIICNITDFNNPWQFRTKYITFYYAYKNITKIVNAMDAGSEKNNLKILIEKVPKTLINSEMRSVLMHYSFINKGKYLINDDYIDYETPYFGLIETLFDGKNYSTISNLIDSNIELFSNTLTSLLNIKRLKYKPLN